MPRPRSWPMEHVRARWEEALTAGSHTQDSMCLVGTFCACPLAQPLGMGAAQKMRSNRGQRDGPASVLQSVARGAEIELREIVSGPATQHFARSRIGRIPRVRQASIYSHAPLRKRPAAGGHCSTWADASCSVPSYTVWGTHVHTTVPRACTR